MGASRGQKRVPSVLLYDFWPISLRKGFSLTSELGFSLETIGPHVSRGAEEPEAEESTAVILLPLHAPALL